jgi:hypothetical protein
MANKKISQLPYIGVSKISGNTLVPLVTYFSGKTATEPTTIKINITQCK